MSSPSPGIGQVLGHYRVIGKIGAGGMGLVYRAHDDRLDRDVAIKGLPPQALADEAARKRFRKEALSLSKLSHPNIGTIYDFDTQDGIDFLVMEAVSGATLAQRVADGTLPEKEVLSLGIQIAQTLQDAHDQGIAHRDLKPGNIMVTPTGHVKLLDFGLARLFRADETTATQKCPPANGPVYPSLTRHFGAIELNDSAAALSVLLGQRVDSSVIPYSTIPAYRRRIQAYRSAT